MKMTMFRAVLFAAALSVGATAAEAHPRLTSLRPVASSSIAAPREVRLTFNEPLIGRFSRITLTDHSGHLVRTGAATFSRDGRQIAVALPQRLTRGAYHVAWRVVSTDTHRVVGGYDFSVSS